jgi:HK97 family phage major capsid protein
MSIELAEIVKTGLTDVQTKTDAKLRELRDQMADLAQRQGTPSGFNATPFKSLGSIVSGSAQLAQLLNRETKSVMIPAPELSLKTLVGDAGGVDHTPVNIQPQRAPGMYNAPYRPLSLLEVMPRVPVISNAFEFIALEGYTNASDYQAKEGDLKAEQDLASGVQTANIATIAVTLPASEQVLADAPGLAMFLDAHLRHGVLSKLERELVAGAGGTGQINGLLPQATAFTTTAGFSNADTIGQAMAQLQATGWTPGIVVMHPNDWHAIRSATASDGQYVAGGWNQPAGPSIWNVPVVTTAAMTEGTVLVMDPAQVALLDRQSVNVSMGMVMDQFSRNAITIRCELRAGLAVFAPSAVLKVTLA